MFVLVIILIKLSFLVGETCICHFKDIQIFAVTLYVLHFVLKDYIRSKLKYSHVAVVFSSKYSHVKVVIMPQRKIIPLTVDMLQAGYQP